MNKNELEIATLSCILQNSELIKNTKLEDKHFKKHKRLFKFFKQFYQKFGTFDLNLMTSVANNKYQMLDYIEQLVISEPLVRNFEKYEKQLIELYELEEHEKWQKDKIYDLATSLYVGNISLKEFEIKLETILNVKKT